MSTKPPKPKAILFDWDDTLIDNWHSIHTALNATLSSMGQGCWSLRKTKSNVRRSMRYSFPRLFGDRWEEAADIFFSTIQSIHLEQIKVLDDVPELLTSLYAAGIYLGVVSNKNGQLLRDEAKFLGWNKFFGAVIGADDAENDKPDPAPIYLALKDTIYAPGEDNIWYVGDAPTDMECAHRAGILPIQIVTKTANPTEFQEFPPKLSFNNAAELDKFVSLL